MRPFVILGVIAALLGGCATEPARTAPQPAPEERTPEPEIKYEPLKLGETFTSVFSSTISQGAVDLDASIPSFEEAEHTETIISIETRLVEMSFETAQELLGANGSSQVFAVATPEAGKLVNALIDAGRAHVISAPRLTCFERQRANISVVTQHAFVSGFEVNDSKGARVLDPVIETVNDGLVLALKPELKDGKISLEINLVEAELVKPMTEGEIKLDGMTIKLQLPVLHIQKLATQPMVEDGGTIMVSRTKATDKGKCIVMFVTVRKVE